VPPAVALLNYIICEILWRIFPQTRQALAHFLTINLARFKKLRDIVEGRIGIQPKMMDPEQDEMNLDPQP
jgi:hypothetical protein